MNALIGVGLALFIFCFVMVVVSASEEDTMSKCSGTIYIHCAPDPPYSGKSYTTWAYLGMKTVCNKADLYCDMTLYHNMLIIHLSGWQSGLIQISPPLKAPTAGYISNAYKWECRNCGAHGELSKDFQVR